MLRTIQQFIFLLSFYCCAFTPSDSQSSRIFIDYLVESKYSGCESGQVLPLDSVSVVANLSRLDIARIERQTGKVLSLLDKEALLQKMLAFHTRAFSTGDYALRSKEELEHHKSVGGQHITFDRIIEMPKEKGLYGCMALLLVKAGQDETCPEEKRGYVELHYLFVFDGNLRITDCRPVDLARRTNYNSTREAAAKGVWIKDKDNIYIAKYYDIKNKRSLFAHYAFKAGAFRFVKDWEGVPAPELELFDIMSNRTLTPVGKSYYINNGKQVFVFDTAFQQRAVFTPKLLKDSLYLTQITPIGNRLLCLINDSEIDDGNLLGFKCSLPDININYYLTDKQFDNPNHIAYFNMLDEEINNAIVQRVHGKDEVWLMTFNKKAQKFELRTLELPQQ
jgi:hypothetical protein